MKKPEDDPRETDHRGTLDSARSSAGRSPIVWLMPRVLLAIILVVISFEIAERWWGAESDDAPRQLRGIAVSILVFATTGIAALRWQPSPFLPVAPRIRVTVESHLAHCVEWFVWMRSLACAMSTVLILLTVDVVGLLPVKLLLPLLICVGCLTAANIVFDALLRKSPATVDNQIWVQVIGDLFVLTLMLHFSGGIENPLSLLFLFHVIISGFLFSRRRCYYISLIAFAFFVCLVLAELYELVPHFTLEVFPHEHEEGSAHAAHHAPYVYSRILLQAMLLLTTGYFITTVMDSLRAREREAREMAERETEARERLESVVETAGAGLRLLDSELQPIWTNARFRAWSTQEEPMLRDADKTLKDGRSRVAEHETVGEDQTKRYYRTTTSAMRGANGNIHHVVLLIQDITAQKRTEAELLHAEKLAAVGELAGNISHEINNPLGVLSARLHLLLSRHSSKLSETITHEIHMMTEMADRITTITRALLDYCRPGASEHRPVLVGPVIERALAVMQAHLPGIDIRIDTAVDSNLPSVQADAGELEQVLVNLLMNAVDVSPSGCRVSVSASVVPLHSGGPALRIVVQDSGPGIPPSLRERVFEPFFTTKQAGKGTGLGLSVCQRIVWDHGGTIRISDAPDSGARFQIDLPTDVG